MGWVEKEGGFSCSTCVSALGPRVGCEVPLPRKQHGNCTLDPQSITYITCQWLVRVNKAARRASNFPKSASCPPVVNITLKVNRPPLTPPLLLQWGPPHKAKRKVSGMNGKIEMRSLKHYLRPSEQSRVAGLSGRLSPCLAGWRIFCRNGWKIGATFPQQHFREQLAAVDGQTQSQGGRGPSSPRDDGDDSKAGGRCRRWRR